MGALPSFSRPMIIERQSPVVYEHRFLKRWGVCDIPSGVSRLRLVTPRAYHIRHCFLGVYLSHNYSNQASEMILIHYMSTLLFVECANPLGMEDYHIRDSQLSSSNFHESHQPAHARPNMQSGNGFALGWKPKTTHSMWFGVSR